jgi:hypothetical protein
VSQLCALADVKSYMGLTDTNQDALLTTLIGNASAFIETYCNRTFAQASYTETRNGGCGPKLYLANGPVVSVSSVSVDGTAVPLAPDAKSYGFVWDAMQVYIRPGGYPGEFTKGIQNVVVSYTAGYVTTPPDVNQACCELIAYKMAKRNRIDKKNEVLAQQTLGFDMSDMPASVKTALQAYIRWNSLS